MHTLPPRRTQGLGAGRSMPEEQPFPSAGEGVPYPAQPLPPLPPDHNLLMSACPCFPVTGPPEGQPLVLCGHLPAQVSPCGEEDMAPVYQEHPRPVWVEGAQTCHCGHRTWELLHPAHRCPTLGNTSRPGQHPGAGRGGYWGRVGGEGRGVQLLTGATGGWLCWKGRMGGEGRKRAGAA